MTTILGIDTGGTFTDFILFNEHGLHTHKVLSTPHAPEQAILQGIKDLGVTLQDCQIIHGSTVATNALLEGKGVRTAYVTNRGLKDILTIGRQARKELYNLQPRPPRIPVDDNLCFEIDCRMAADGQIIKDLEEQDLEDLCQQIKLSAPQAVAINLLFSFRDDSHEKRIQAKLQSLGFVCRSSEILPEYKEYERGIATWLNAYVGPLMMGYLQRLQQGVHPAKLSIMQSSGGTINATTAAKHSVNLLLSGPAGGLRGAQYIGRQYGKQALLTFDMGGTSTDVALIDGEIGLTNEGEISGFPVAVPMVDMHTIGAGGGSIAWLDEGGMLQVGPQSAGAAPGPACYGQGGTAPTVTDANLVLGRLQSEEFLGGNMRLDVDAATTALSPLAKSLNLSIEAVADGIIRIANEHMAQALRVISVQRGMDPRHYVLTSFGGAGGLHVCALAESLGMTQALVPIHGGVLSALGMLVSPHSREYSKTVTRQKGMPAEHDIENIFQSLEQQGRQALLEEGIAADLVSLSRMADLRYRGQSYTLGIAWQDLTTSVAVFHATHQQRFGHKLEEEVELVNLRVKTAGPEPDIRLPELPQQSDNTQLRRCILYGIQDEVSVYRREALNPAQQIIGPALITEKVSTTYVAPGWTCRTDKYGNLGLEK